MEGSFCHLETYWCYHLRPENYQYRQRNLTDSLLVPFEKRRRYSYLLFKIIFNPL